VGEGARAQHAGWRLLEVAPDSAPRMARKHARSASVFSGVFRGQLGGHFAVQMSRPAIDCGSRPSTLDGWNRLRQSRMPSSVSRRDPTVKLNIDRGTNPASRLIRAAASPAASPLGVSPRACTRSEEAKPVEFADGEGPQRGDLVIYFPPFFETEAEAAMTPEEYLAWMRTAAVAPVPLPCTQTLKSDALQCRRPPDPELDELAEVRAVPELRALTTAEMRNAAGRLLRTGHLFARIVVRGALQTGVALTRARGRGPGHPRPVARTRRRSRRRPRWTAA
jgi:hypothetical protein